jgi:hypothetical protein
VSVRDVTIRGEEFQNGTQGLKAAFVWAPVNTALKGPLFHGTIGGIAHRDTPAAIEGFEDRNLSVSRAHGTTWKSPVEERRFSAASEARENGTESRRDGTEPREPCEDDTTWQGRKRCRGRVALQRRVRGQRKCNQVP